MFYVLETHQESSQNTCRLDVKLGEVEEDMEKERDGLDTYYQKKKRKYQQSPILVCIF